MSEPNAEGAPSRTLLGDSHNFGRRVSIGDDGRVEKPRCIEWERIFLGDSPFRRELASVFRSAGVPDPLRLFPTLSFHPSDDGDFSGRVGFLQWSRESPPLDDDLCAHIGAVVGLASWFGMGDLHRQNVAFGTLPDGRPVCSPLDIECLLSDHELPSQSRLIGYHDASGKGCGLVGFQKAFEDSGRSPSAVAAVLHGYAATLSTLTAKEWVIAAALGAERDVLRWPIRVILRDTSRYQSILAGASASDALKPPLMASESAQLARKDIPYYYREAGAQEKRWLVADRREWGEASEAVPIDINDFPALRIMRTLAPDCSVAWANRRSLLAAGTLQIARMLSASGRSDAEFGGITLSVASDRIAVAWGDDPSSRWACPR